MKKLYLILLSFCFTVLLNAQIPKTSANTTGGLTSKTDTTKRTVSNLTNKGKINAQAIKTLPKSKEVLKELENAVHGNQLMQAGFLNRPSTTQELMSLTGTDKISAGKLLMELENNLQSGAIAPSKSPSQPPSNIGNNAQTTGLLAKVQNLNRLMAMNNTDMDNTKNTPSELNRPGMDDLKSEQNFELNRMESEKQTMAEMENYRNEILDRLIKEEYYRLINDKTPAVTDNNMDRTSKLAKYKTLRNLLQEQISRQSKPISANSGQANLPPKNPQELNNIRQQLDLKIRDEEQRAEMFSRQRMEMEGRIGQGNQNKNQNQKQNK